MLKFVIHVLLQSDLVSVHLLDKQPYVVLTHLPPLRLIIDQPSLCVHHLAIRVQPLQHLQHLSVNH
jgi:hypothetical protein